MEFIGRERELQDLNGLYRQNRFQMFVLYGRRRVGKTTLLSEFCRGKDAIFYSAEQSNEKLNLEKFSAQIFDFYGETTLEPFASWTNALTYIKERQGDRSLVLVLDEFPYLVRKNRGLLSEFQHLIDHSLQQGPLFLVLCGSYMGFMEKEVLGSKSPLFGRRTGQLRIQPLDYRTSLRFMNGFTPEDQLKLYGAFGGIPLYLSQIDRTKSFEDNIRYSYLRPISYLYEEPLLLLRQEVQEPGVYSAVIEAIAGGATRANEIAVKIGEEPAKCLKYIRILCELGIVYKETPFGEKETSRKTIYGISDFMFRFWYRYVFSNRTLVETGAAEVIWQKRIAPDYSNYMGLAFEKICREYLLLENAEGRLPILFTSIGRWWGSNPHSTGHEQVEIDLIAQDGDSYLFAECKWRNELLDLPVLEKLRQNADVFRAVRGETWYILFSKSGFTDRLYAAAQTDEHIMLVGLEKLTAVSM